MQGMQENAQAPACRACAQHAESGAKQSEHRLDVEVEPCFQRVLAHEVDVEDQAARVAIGQVEYPIAAIVMYSCRASTPLRNTPASTPRSRMRCNIEIKS